MSLAAIFLLSATCTVVAASSGSLTTDRSVLPELVQASAAQSQDQPPPTQKSQEKPAAPTPAPQQTGPQQKPSSSKRVRHKKKPVPPNCPTASTASEPPSSSTSNSTQTSAVTSAGSATAPASETPADTKNCPPSKIIVRQGGTPETSIQLAGPAGGDQGTQALANQMVGTAEANLEKIGDRQLNQSQQDMVAQIRQFIDQSKAATAAGDPSRARTLAWKAQTLSEDLVKPEK